MSLGRSWPGRLHRVVGRLESSLWGMVFPSLRVGSPCGIEDVLHIYGAPKSWLIADGLNPSATSQTPSENSHSAIGRTPIPVRA